jgi:hypothetical protein
MDVRQDQDHFALLKRTASNCRAIIAYQVGLPLGCVRMHKMLSQLGPRRDLGFAVFAEYLAAVRPYAIGNDRLKWNREALFKQDRSLEQINNSFRDRIHTACHDILALLEAEGTAG